MALAWSLSRTTPHRYLLPRSYLLALLTLPDPEPLIDNVLDMSTTALLYGNLGTAEIVCRTRWAASVASGRKWQGRRCEQRRVLYVVGEGVFGFKVHVAAWERDWQHQIADEWLGVLPAAVNLTKPIDVANPRALIDWGGLQFRHARHAGPMHGRSDENSAKDCGAVVDAVTRLMAAHQRSRRRSRVHHAGKDGQNTTRLVGFRGWR